jgi:hypothetical protein
MTPRLSSEFKRKASEHILNISKELISKYFDKEPGLRDAFARDKDPPAIVDDDGIMVEISKYFIDNKPKVIKIENEQMMIEISRQCFPDTDGRFNYKYYEDYRVDIVTTIEDEKIWSKFYLEWKNEVPFTELIYSSCSDPSGNGKIKIKKYKGRLLS